MDTSERLVLVKSCKHFRGRQVAVRATWASALREAGIRVMFLEGQSMFPRMDGDRLCVVSGDSYGWNTVKLREGLRLAVRDLEFSRLFVCDDDTFVHPLRWLGHEPEGELECRVFDFKLRGKKPWVSGGSGWWMSRRLCQLYADTVRERHSSDDIAVARVAQAHGIVMTNRPDLYGGDHYSGLRDMVASDNKLITCHPVLPAAMRTLWRELCVCL